MDKLKDKPWKIFEVAVSNFIDALDPNASVTHDAMVPDRDTGTPRQRDVWIEAKVANHFPIKVLVSCKRYRKKLNQMDIDHFNGELASSEAQLGVIYSHAGFAENAIKKAKLLGISCCQLYHGSQPDIPGKIVFASSYACYPQISIALGLPLDPFWKIKKWNDFFEVVLHDDGEEISGIDVINKHYLEGEKAARVKMKKGEIFPPSWQNVIRYVDDVSKKELTIIINGKWEIYEGRLEAHLVNGSYNFTSDEFVGGVYTPALNVRENNPGAGWKLIESKSEYQPKKALFRSSFIMSAGDVEEALVTAIGEDTVAFGQVVKD